MGAPHCTASAPRPLRSEPAGCKHPYPGLEELEAGLLAGELGAQRCRKWVGWVMVGHQGRPQGQLSSLWLYLGVTLTFPPTHPVHLST